MRKSRAALKRGILAKHTRRRLAPANVQMKEPMDQESMKFFESLFRSLETEMAQRFDRVDARLDRMETRLDKIAAGSPT